MKEESIDWSEEIRRLYLSGATNQFVIYGNVNDRILLPAKKEIQRIGTLSEYLSEVQLKKFDIVLTYELGAGLRVDAGEELFQRLRFDDSLPKEPAEAIAFIDRFLRFCVNLRNLSPGNTEISESLAGKNHHVAVIIRSSELIFPLSKQSRDYQLNSMASVVRSWSNETYFLEQNLAVFLLADRLNDLNALLSGNTRAARIEIPMPQGDMLEEVFSFFESRYPEALQHFVGRPSEPAIRLSGATINSIESLLRLREYEKQPLQTEDLSDLKKSLVERDADGLIEFLEPSRTLDDVFGHEKVKAWFREDISLWAQGDLGVMPMGYLLCGPVGTGKTYLVECLAGEAGVPVVKLKNFRDRWVGSTEGNLEKIFGMLHALGRCIVFIDEADQALGKRDSGSGDSGVSGRVYSMMAKEMSRTENRGRILWILASSRPDLIEVDLKRPGRVDVKIPLFPAHEPADAYRLIRALGKKHDLELPKECPDDILPLVPTLVTPGAAEALAIKVYRTLKTTGKQAIDSLKESLEDYQSPIPQEVMEFQIGLAVSEASDLEFVPETFR
ncbi:MAG: AAA family ATPase [Verrucomicrobiota bacterium]